MMSLTLRPGRPDDAQICGRICYEAFKAIAQAHNFPPDFPNAEAGIALAAMLLANPRFYGVVAELDGRIVGSNFMDERAPIAGVGPITVDPAVQNQGVGRQLMTNVLERARQRQYPGVRLVQAAYHMRSLSLYTKLGYDTRETLSTMQGAPLNLTIPGYTVRAATDADVDACNRLCIRVHGHHRGGELADAIKERRAMVVERGGRITAYTTAIAFFAHTVGETNDDVEALIGAARSFEGPGFLLPSRNAELMRWCLAHGLRVMQQLTLMTIGLYNEPTGAWLPSVLY
jgi:predicted N-acetyltransferase YhbS